MYDLTFVNKDIFSFINKYLMGIGPSQQEI